MFDIKQLQEDCQKELAAEKAELAKKRIKNKLKELDTAETVVANIKRELNDLYESISQGN